MRALLACWRDVPCRLEHRQLRLEQVQVLEHDRVRNPPSSAAPWP